MQKIATRVFIIASIAFGILGIAWVVSLTINGDPDNSSVPGMIISRLLMLDVFIILPALALSLAGKYLKDKS